MTAAVYKAIASVMQDLAKVGIAKDRVNEQQRFKFRGIDDVYNALSPALSTHGLCILPRVLSREVTERQAKQGGVLFSVTVDMEFDFVAAEDGSKHTIRTVGEAMDSGDKATNKAMSAAYKYAAMQAFCIPTEGDNDADATTHEVAPSKGMAGASAKPAPRNNAATDSEAEQAVALMRQAKTAESLSELWRTPWIAAIVKAGGAASERLIEAKDQRKAELTANLLASG